MAANDSKSLNSNTIDRIDSLQKRADSLSGKKDDKSQKEREKIEKAIQKLRIKLDKEAIEKERDARIEQAKEIGDLKEQIELNIQKKVAKLSKENLAELTDMAAAATKLITNKLDGTIDSYVSQIQAMNAHLVGTNNSFSSLTDTLQNALSATGLVSQQKVFNNLTEYVKSGITYNVEQRAFLKTIADDISLIFDGWTSSMNQLIRIQQQDSTANRLALEYSLQEFLNENYQTSEYIKNSFAEVSNALITSQSTMTAQNAMAYEATIQSWLGSLYSAGANQGTINSLATAIDKLGSGDITGIGTGISNLVLMGAARAGLDYGAILNQGLTADTTDRLLAGITSYMSEMSGQSSNVVRSQLGQLFGVNITDLIAASNVGNTSGGVSTDIYSTLFKDYAGLTSGAVRLTNLMDNMMFTWGTNIASTPWELMTYKVTELISENLGEALSGYTVGLFGNTVNLGSLAKSAPLLALIPSLVQTLGFDMLPSLINGTNGITWLFNSLGSAIEGTTVKISDAGVSGSAYFGTGSTSDILNSSMSSLNSTLSETSVVTQEGPTLEENVTTITSDVATIVELLQDHLVAIDNQLSLMGGTSTMMYSYAHDNFGI